MKIASVLLSLFINCILVAQNSTTILPQNLRFGQAYGLVKKTFPDMAKSPFHPMIIPDSFWEGVENWEQAGAEGPKKYILGFNGNKLTRLITYYGDTNYIMKALAVLKNKLSIVKIRDDQYSILYAGSSKNAVVYSFGIWGNQISDGYVIYLNPNETDPETAKIIKSIRSEIDMALKKEKKQLRQDNVDY